MRCDADATRRFIETLWPATPEGESRFCVFATNAKRKQTTWHATIDGAVADLAKLGATWNAYFGVALHNPALADKSRCNASATGICGLWADIDVAGPNHKAENLPPTFDDARWIVEQTRVAPSVVALTGGGLQAWWLFAEPWMFSGAEDHDAAARLSAAWVATIQAKAEAREWGVDGTGDLARLLRPAGTLNHKSDPPALVIAEYADVRYQPSDFEEFIEPAIRAVVGTAPQGTPQEADVYIAQAALASLAPSRADVYDDWIRAGMVCRALGVALGHEPAMFDLWDGWSRQSGKYDADAVRTKWESFHANGTTRPVTLGTLIEWARRDSGGVAGYDSDEIKAAPLEPSATVATVPLASDPAPAFTPPATKPRLRVSDGLAVTSRPVVANVADAVVTDDEGGEKRVAYYKTTPAVAAEIVGATGGWPRRAGGILFAVDHDPANLDPIPDRGMVNYLTDVDSFFAWVGKHCDVRWSGEKCVHPLHKAALRTPVTKREIFAYLVDNATPDYRAVEVLPHEPPIGNTYYLPNHLPPTGDEIATPLIQLISEFNPDTEDDRMLMLAALLTPGWGGPSGTRPAFVFTSDHGKGVGKTITAETLAELWGGCVSVGANDDFEVVKKRLVCDDSLTKRICIIDNLKGKLHGSEIEGCITAKAIDGWKPYHGQASRPNTLTWFITANSPSMSQDLSVRSVVIKVGKPLHGKDFVTWASDFMDAHRAEILADVYAILRRSPRCSIDKGNRDRWVAWQNAVLAKLDSGNQLAKLIIERRGAVDADTDDAEEIAGVVMKMVADLYPGHERERIFITSQQLYGQLLKEGLASPQYGLRGTRTFVGDKCGQGPLHFLKPHRMNHGRGWLYVGEKSTPLQDVVDLPDPPRDWHGQNG